MRDEEKDRHTEEVSGGGGWGTGCRELARPDGIAPDWCNTTEH